MEYNDPIRRLYKKIGICKKKGLPWWAKKKELKDLFFRPFCRCCWFGSKNGRFVTRSPNHLEVRKKISRRSCKRSTAWRSSHWSTQSFHPPKVNNCHTPRLAIFGNPSNSGFRKCTQLRTWMEHRIRHTSFVDLSYYIYMKRHDGSRNQCLWIPTLRTMQKNSPKMKFRIGGYTQTTRKLVGL